MIKAAIFTMLTLLVDASLACEQHSPRRGYWFYQECAETKSITKNDKYMLPPLPPHKELMRAHPQDIARILKERLEYAVYKMTPESVVDYYKVIDASRRKSLAFTALSEYVMLKHPELNAKSQNPTTIPARKASTLIRNNEHANYIAANKKDYALVMLSREKCQFCSIQEAALKHFQSKFGWKYKVIDADINPDIAIQFNASVTPTTVLIKRGSEQWMPVSVGAESVSEIEVGVYRALRLLKNEISPQQFILERYREGGFFDPVTEQSF